MKQRTRLFAIAAVSTWTLCLAGHNRDDDAVRIAVLETMFAEQRELQGLVLFIAVGDRSEMHKGVCSDPSEDFLNRLKTAGWDAEPRSRAIQIDMMAGFKDAKTGRQGVRFCAGRVEWLSSDEASVYGESYRNGKSAEGARYRVAREANAWKVTSRTSIWKS